MKKYVFVLGMFLLHISLFAQKETTESLEKFQEIKVYDRIKATLVQSQENKVIIKGDDRDEVEATVKDGLLKIRMETGNFLDGDDIRVTVYHTETLSLIDSNEGAVIDSEGPLTSSQLEVRAQEGGLIEMEIKVGDLTLKAVSGGEISLTGKADHQDITVNTGGKAYNKLLKTGTTVVTVSAGGIADVDASEKVDAKVRAGGAINIYGKTERNRARQGIRGKDQGNGLIHPWADALNSRICPSGMQRTEISMGLQHTSQSSIYRCSGIEGSTSTDMGSPQ